MDTIFSVAQVLVAIAMVAIILVQRGAGAAAGSGFGAGASATVFGSRGSRSFLTRVTAILATAFFSISLVMAIMSGRANNVAVAPDLGVMEGVATEQVDLTPGAPSIPAFEPLEDDDVPSVLAPAVDEMPEVIDEPSEEGDNS